MSGYKRATVSISQDEYDRLREAERSLRALPQANEDQFQAIVQRSTQQLQSELSEIQQRQSRFTDLISGMDGTIREVEQATSQAMLAYESRALAEVQNYTGCLWDHFDHVINERNQYFEATIAANQQEFQQELMQYSRQLRRLADDQAQKREIAENWLDAAQAFSDFIQQYYAHEAFLPGRYDRLQTQLNQARINLESGLSEAVVVMAQQLYFAFSDIRIELERLQNEWQMLLNAAWEAVNQVLVQLESSRVVPAVDLDGILLPEEIDVNYWSQGRLDQLQADLSFMRDCLESQAALPDSETLERWLNIDLPGYLKALEDIVLDSRVNALNSQLRINIADLVVCALQEQGFALETSSYTASDQRSGYDARLTNLEGNEVIVQVSPAGSELGANELHLRSMDREEKTEHELHQRWSEVSRSLSRYGLAVGSYIREDAPRYQTSTQAQTNRAISPSRLRRPNARPTEG